MKKQLIVFDPEIIQFVSDRTQLVKVTNLTQKTIENCFFCMYNTDRYEFTPNYFSLEPQEQKLVTVNFLSKLGPKQIKQFAYLKSSNLSKRVTLIHGPSTISDSKFRSPESGIEEIYTLSSRDYRETQMTAYEKIIADKQAYIQRLQRLNQQLKDQSNRKSIRQQSQPSDHKTKNFYLNQIEALEVKITLLNKQKQQFIRENVLMQQRFEEYKQLMASDSKYEQINQLLIQKNQLICRQNEQIQFLESQCEQFLSKISQKQSHIRQIEEYNNKKINTLNLNNDKIISKLQEQLLKSKENHAKANKIYEERISQLEQSVLDKDTDRQRIKELETQINMKKKEVDKIFKELNSEKQQRTKVQQIKEKNLSIKKINTELKNNNNNLSSRVQMLEKQLEEIREQNILFKSKMEEHDQSTSKIGHYLEVALESSKNQNSILKNSKIDLEKQISDHIKIQKNYENKIETLQRKFNESKRELEGLNAEKQEIQSRNRKTKQQSHETLMKLKSENIDLIEKISVFNNKQDVSQQLKELKNQLNAKNTQLLSKHEEIANLQQQNDKHMKRIDKVRRETKRQIKSIQDDAIGELKKVKGDKIKLTKKVAQLEESINNSETHDLSRAKTKTHYDTPYNGTNTNAQTRCPRSQGDRKIFGIRNQRRQLQQSRSSSNLPEIDIESLYSELGQLRQFKVYVNNELDKIGNMIGIIYPQKENTSEEHNNGSIFSTINFFEELKDQMRKTQSSKNKVIQFEKQTQFLKGRLAQLEHIQRQNRELQNREIASSIEIEKNENHQQLLEYVRKQMKTQYAKQYDALKLAEEKFLLLKKKIYEEYRSRIIGVLSKSSKGESIVPKIESILERFINGLANLSHKQAVLSKQVKLKISARRQADSLRAKVKTLTQMLEVKKGYCSREPINLYMCDSQNQWHDNIKLSAQILTLQSQMSKLKEQLDLSKTNANYLDDELKVNLTQLQTRQDEVLRLKKQIIRISNDNERQLTKRQEELDVIQKKYLQSGHRGDNKKKNNLKETQFQAMKDDLQKKKDIIRNLKDREVMLEQLLESTQRNQSANRQKDRRQVMQQQRMENSLRDFKEYNRQLRGENCKLKDQIKRLEEQLGQKNNVLKRFKNDGEEHRIRALKSDENNVEKLKNDIVQLKEQIRKSKQSYDKLKKKRDKQIQQFESDTQRLKNEYLIQQKSYESIIRALVDTMRRIYSALDIIMRKKGKKINESPDFDELIKSPGDIDSLKVYESFEKVIQTLRQ